MTALVQRKVHAATLTTPAASVWVAPAPIRSRISRLLADLHQLFTPLGLTLGCRQGMTWNS
jgi:hypothetical protein